MAGLGWRGGTEEAEAALRRESVSVVAEALSFHRGSAAYVPFHYSWLIPPTHEQGIEDSLLLLFFFLFPFNKVSPPSFHFEWNTKTMRLFCSTSMSFSYGNLISNQHFFPLPQQHYLYNHQCTFPWLQETGSYLTKQRNG